MKKKILSVALVVALFAIAAVGTLAYFTDDEQATNVFTAAGIDIKLIEQERGEEGLQGFTQEKPLFPIVGSAQGEKDEYGQPVAENYLDKMITVKNVGISDAFVRVYFAIPSAVDDGNETFNAGLNILHFNFGNYQDDNGEWHTTYQNQWDWKTANGNWNYFETTIKDVKYNVYFADYYQALAPDATTEYYVSGVYLDKDVNMFVDEEGVHYTITRNGQTVEIEGFDGSAICPVFAVAVQTAGFNSVDAAVAAAFGEQYNPWGGEVTNWQD